MLRAGLETTKNQNMTKIYKHQKLWQTTTTGMEYDRVLPAVYFNWVGCSRWTNSSRSMAIHISKNNDGEPICGKQYSGGTLRREELNLSEVTCKKCLSLYGR